MQTKNRHERLIIESSAGRTDRERFELSKPLQGMPVFETGAFNHSATCPGSNLFTYDYLDHFHVYVIGKLQVVFSKYSRGVQTAPKDRPENASTKVNDLRGRGES